MTEKIGTREGGLGPLLVEIRKARPKPWQTPAPKFPPPVLIVGPNLSKRF